MVDFKVGDEVVCVNNTNRPNAIWFPGCKPQLNTKYTVTGLLIDPWGDPAVTLAELDNADTGYAAWRFRKVQKRNDRLTIEAFMTVPGGFEDPKRTTPAKKRERT